MAKTRTDTESNVTSTVPNAVASDDLATEQIACKLFIDSAAQGDARGRTIESVATRCFEMAETFIRVRNKRRAAPTQVVE